jgi:hypothetical protein
VPQKKKTNKKNLKLKARCWWLTPVILEAEIRKIIAGSQSRQIVHKTLS